MARGSPNKKLLEPLGCQESSAPVNITGRLWRTPSPFESRLSLTFSRIAGRPIQRNLLEAAPQAAATALAPPLQMKTVANLDVEFARVQVVSSAESKTVVEQDTAIGDVQ